MLTELSLCKIREELRLGSVSAEEVTAACISVIEKSETKIHALLSTRLEAALNQAKEMDNNRPKDISDKPLWGIPVTVKDVICTDDMPTTAGSKILEGFIPPYNAFVVDKLRSAGAIILGKNNMDEFAMGSSTENSAYSITRNPWNVDCVPGGSSGGSAASVAALQCYGSLGSDTGGSVRQPSALCGCVGIKPTYGRVSRYGLLAYGSSFDQIGPIARSVEDAALLLQVIAGYDKRDSTSTNIDVPNYCEQIKAQKGLKGVTIGIPKEFFEHGELDPGIKKLAEQTVLKAKDVNAKIVEISLPHTEYSIAAYYILASAEASSNLARYDGVRYGHRTHSPKNLEEMYTFSRTEGFGAEVQRRILLGSYVLSAGYYDAYYRKAAQVRRLIRDDYLKALNQCDMILAPVSPVPAWKVGEMTGDPLKMYLMDIFTLSLNLAGLPGLSFPVGFSDNLPVGMQLMGKPFDEGSLLAAGNNLAIPWRTQGQSFKTH